MDLIMTLGGGLEAAIALTEKLFKDKKSSASVPDGQGTAVVEL